MKEHKGVASGFSRPIIAEKEKFMIDWIQTGLTAASVGTGVAILIWKGGGFVNKIEMRFDNLDKRMDGFEKRMDGFEKRMDVFDIRMNKFEKRLDRLSHQVTKIRVRLGKR